MEYAAGVAIVKTIGIDVTIQCAKALSCTAKGVYDLLRSISSTDNGGSVSKYIEETDLECMIKVMEKVVLAIDVNKHHTDPLLQCIEDLQTCLTLTEQILKEYQKRIDYNRSIWFFSSFRAYGFSDLHENLQLQVRHLNGRYDRLSNTIKMNAYLLPSVTAEKSDEMVIVN